MKKAVQFGAGNIGRGFLADLYTSSGYRVIFVEVVEEIVREINERGGYILEIAIRPPSRKEIKGISAVNARDKEGTLKEIWDGDIFSTSVGKRNLPSVAEYMAEVVKKRFRGGKEEPFNLILAENISRGEETMREYIYSHLNKEERRFADKSLGIVESVIARMVPVVEREIKEKDPLYIRVEEYRLLPVDKRAFRGEIPSIEGMVPVEDIKALEARKLYMHNLPHSVIAYLGYLRGYRFIHESVQDEWILSIVKEIWEECEKGLVNEYGFHLLPLREHREDLLRRFGNPLLRDSVTRVSRDPLRKLSPEERLIGGARFIQRHGGSLRSISKGIASALLYDYPEDSEAIKLQKNIREKGIEWVLHNLLGINPREPLGEKVIKDYHELSAIKLTS